MELNKIYNEDCMETMKRMPDNFVDLVITSPPYYNAKDYVQYINVEKYIYSMVNIFTDIEKILKRSRMCVVIISPILIKREKRSCQSKRLPLPFYFVPMMESIGFEFLEDIIWKKPDGAAKNRNGGFYVNRKPIAYKPNIVTEYVLVFKKSATFLIDKILKNDSYVVGEYERTNVWEVQPDTKSLHPAPFPVGLIQRIIKYYSYENDIIYDPFIGSGTTARAAIAEGRQWLGSENNLDYCEIANKRINAERNQTKLVL